MESTFFTISLIIISIAYLAQIHKMLKRKEAQGVSLDAYSLSCISLTVILFSSNDFLVQILTAIELTFVLISIYIIFIYQGKFNVSKDFLIAAFFSFLMIFSVAQVLKSMRENSSSVSIIAYLLWGGLNGILIYLSNDIYIQIPLVITNILYIYIIYKALKSENVSLFKKVCKI